MARRRSSEFKGKYSEVGPQEASPDAQAQYIDTEAQKHTSAIVLSANDPEALGDSLTKARDAGTKVVTFDADTNPKYRDLFINQASAEGIGKVQVDMIADQIGDKGEIAILSATANAANQNAWIEIMKTELKQPPEHQAGRHRLRRRRRPEVVRQDRGAAAEAPEPEGHHLAHHGRHHGCCSLPVEVRQQGQGRADRSRHAQPDA